VVSDDLLERWLAALVDTPGLTSLALPEARRMLLEDSLRAEPLVRRLEGPLVDVGSGGGAPGIPLAASLPELEVTLLEAERRKCDFLEPWTDELANLRVVWGRAEDQPTDTYGVAVAKALALPPVAAEWCLPLVRQGGCVVLFVGPTADVGGVARVAEQVGGGEPELRDGLLTIPKVAPTPAGFPRRAGAARKRPLA
jgi:16S rRNA (guanine527-N7)-methyltransferase